MYLNNEIARQELRTISRGKVSRVPIAILAAFVLGYCTPGAGPNPEPGTHDDSAQWLTRLYALRDPRPQSLHNGAGA
jgi:hypothetical protein